MRRVSAFVRMDRLCVLQLTGILDGGDTSAKVGTRYGPASLGDPDPLARRDTVDCCLFMLLDVFMGLLWGVEENLLLTFVSATDLKKTLAAFSIEAP